MRYRRSSANTDSGECRQGRTRWLRISRLAWSLWLFVVLVHVLPSLSEGQGGGRSYIKTKPRLQRRKARMRWLASMVRR